MDEESRLVAGKYKRFSKSTGFEFEHSAFTCLDLLPPSKIFIFVQCRYLTSFLHLIICFDNGIAPSDKGRAVKGAYFQTKVALCIWESRNQETFQIIGSLEDAYLNVFSVLGDCDAACNIEFLVTGDMLVVSPTPTCTMGEQYNPHRWKLSLRLVVSHFPCSCPYLYCYKAQVERQAHIMPLLPKSCSGFLLSISEPAKLGAQKPIEKTEKP